MPRIAYKCSKCSNSKNRFFSNVKKIEDKIECNLCLGEMVRTLSSPSQRSTMVIDNGVQAKAVEIDTQIVEIIEDRSERDLHKRGDSVLENLK
jgi:DNA-directed RNA polymerase subunit RPC12/RpoP